jgi:hypothetical protein
MLTIEFSNVHHPETMGPRLQCGPLCLLRGHLKNTQQLGQVAEIASCWQLAGFIIHVAAGS